MQPFGGPRRAIALLAYVLLHRGRALSRAAVAEQFWPDEEDENARASLRRHLHRALAALPEAPANRPWVIADKVTLRWNPEAPLELDTDRYERLSGSGEREAAVGLYRGDYLDEFYDDWVLPERERLRELQSANLASLVEERRRALDYPGAIAFAQALSRLDPLREDAIRRLMSLRFAAGDRSGALAEFETFVRRLRDELSTDPMPETVALRESIRTNELQTLERERVATAPAERPGFPFAGRIAAMRSLRDAWESAAHGNSVTAVVSGQAGIGKSRLIGELTALAEAQGGRVMFGSTAAIETEPYQAVAEALRGALPLVRFDRLEPVKLAALSALVPEIRELAKNLPPLSPLEPERDRARLFDAVVAVFEQVAEKRPLLVVFEDVHWAGPATVELVDYCARRLSGRSVLLLVSFREEDVDGSHALHAFLRRLGTRRSTHIALGPLEESDVNALVAGVAGGDFGASFAGELFAASEGNALFITELLRERMSGVVAGTVPAGIAELASARVQRLSPAARSLVEVAAVTGVGFDTEVVRQACGWSFAEVFDALDELLEGALVRLSPQRRGDFAFSHQLVHAAVYETVDAASRRTLHRRVARTLETLFSSRPSLAGTVARHFDTAGFPIEAVTRYLQAIRHARDVFSHVEAMSLATRALEISVDERQRFDLHRLRDDAAERAGGDLATRRDDCDAMADIARNLGDDDLHGLATSRALSLHLQRSELDAASACIDLLTALGQRAASARWSLEGVVAKARFLSLRGDMLGAQKALLDAEPLLSHVADDELTFEYWYARSIATQVDLVSARAFLGEAERSAGADRMRAARALRARAMSAFNEGDRAAYERVAHELLDLYREIGDIGGQAQAQMYLAVAAWYRLDLLAALEHSSEALALFERIEKPDSAALVVLNRGVFSSSIGDFASAERDFRKAIAISEATGIFHHAATARANLASDALLRGDAKLAHDLALEAFSFAGEHRLEDIEIFASEVLGGAERDLGLFVAARDRLEIALRWRREHQPARVLEVLLHIVPVYVALGQHDEALFAAEELVLGLSGNHTLLAYPAKGLFTAAAAYEFAGKPERATALRIEARELLECLAGRITDEPSRAGYLSHPAHREILSR